MRKSENKHRFGLTFKVVLLSACSIIITAISLSFVASNKMRDLYIDSISDNMLNLAISYGQILDEELLDNSGNELTTAEYSNILSKVNISGYSSGYAYLASSAGITLYHPKSERIGQPIENTAVQGIVAEIGSGFYRAPEVIEYLFNGERKFAAFHVSDVDHSILVITLDKDDILDTISDQRLSFLFSAAFISLIFILIVFIIALFITRPFRQLVTVSEKLKNMDLNNDLETLKLDKRKDECGSIAKALATLRKELSDIVFELTEVSTAVKDSSGKIQDLSTVITDKSTKNSTSTKELEENLQLTAASTELIENNINSIKDKTEDIENHSSEGSDLARTVIERANNLKSASDASIEETANALADAKSVEKIQVLTNSIRAISTQTSMLSLNAAIEAARAGDQGRGFAVVASEIGELANQSTESVNRINSIVAEVSNSVKKMTDALNHIIAFIDNNVIPGFSELSDVGAQYAADAKSFGVNMDTISRLTSELSFSISEIVSSIDGINSQVENATNRIADIAGKNVEIVKATTLSDDLLVDNTKDSERLNSIVKKFKH